MSETVIREATPRDLLVVGELWRELQQVNTSFEPRLAPDADAAQWIITYLEDHLDGINNVVYVAAIEGQIVGYIFGQVMRRPTLQFGDCGYIADLYVRDGFRGQGLGRRLYDRLRAWFVARGVASIEVQVIRANPGSQTFWRKMGFGDFLRTLRKDF